MEQLTYRQAYDRIIEAYFKDEIKPVNATFCFCGTLCGNSNLWHKSTTHKIHNPMLGYSGEDFVKMERALLDEVWKANRGYETQWEEAMFKGMSNALDVLKEIHKSRGENVDKEISQPFIQRKLAEQSIS